MHRAKKRSHKKLIISVIAVILAAALLVGILFLVRNHAGGAVNVYPVSQVSTSADYAYETETEGAVTADKIQSVYISSTQQVTEVYVTEGQTVAVGDPILAYDTTLNQVELDRQAITVQQLELDLENEEKNLAAIGNYAIGSGGSYTASTGTSAGISVSVSVPYFKGGSGTADDPYVWMWSDSIEYTDAVIQMILNPPIQEEAEPTPTPVPTEESQETAEPEETDVPEETDTPETTDVPEETDTPEATDAPEETDTPETTDAPEETDTPETTDAPEETDTPETTDAPEETDTPETTDTPEETDTPETTDTPEETDTPETTDTPEETDTPETTEPPEDTDSGAEEGDGRVYVVFEIRESNVPKGVLTRCWEMVFREVTSTITTADTDTDDTTDTTGPADGDDAAGENDSTGDTDDTTAGDAAATTTVTISSQWVFSIIEPNYVPDEEETDEEVYIDTTVYYTASEVAQLKSESQQRIADLTLQLKMAQLEYEQLEYELSNGVIYATVAGTVKTVRDPDEALAESSPVVLISGGGGYYVTGVLGEFDLDTMAVGDTVTVYSWQSGEQIEGTITEISEYPTESDEYYYYTDGNTNISKYPFTVMVDEDANLREGEYVYIYIANSGWDDDGSVYLYNPFLRTEGGKSYIWVAAEDGTLEKRYVTTGMSIWGSYTQITSGLTEGDYVAFPYSKSLREGAKVKYNEDTDSLYGY